MIHLQRTGWLESDKNHSGFLKFLDLLNILLAHFDLFPTNMNACGDLIRIQYLSSLLANILDSSLQWLIRLGIQLSRKRSLLLNEGAVKLNS